MESKPNKIKLPVFRSEDDLSFNAYQMDFANKQVIPKPGNPFGHCIGDYPDNYAQFHPDGELNLHGTARVNNHIRVGAASFKPGPIAPTEEQNGMFWTLNYDWNREDSAFYTLIVPYRMATGSDIEVEIDWFHEKAAATGAVRWGVEYIFIDCDEAVEGATTTTEVTSGATVTGQLQCTEFTTGLTGGEAHDMLGIRVFRNHDHGEDGLNDRAKLIAVHLHFLKDKLGQAT